MKAVETEVSSSKPSSPLRQIVTNTLATLTSLKHQLGDLEGGKSIAASSRVSHMM